MTKILHFDCFSGISGDMTIAALLDLGLEGDRLRRELLKLNLSGYSIDISQQLRSGIRGTSFSVDVDGGARHEHRHLPDIEALIMNCDLEPAVKEGSIRTFRFLGAAEARIHQVAPEQVHFHEVGAVDAIIDIVGAAICLSWLKPDRITVSGINTGSGFVDCAHGRLPVPAPATLELLQGFNIYSSGEETEMATPTGAAILRSYARPVAALPMMKMEGSGYGCGRKNLDNPNLLRIVSGWATPDADAPGDYDKECWILETNIDDMNPEYYSHLFPLLLQNGALDVFVAPVLMKKNRPGQMLSLLCRSDCLERLEELVLRQTSTFGVRKYRAQRQELARETRLVSTRFGPVAVKCGLYKGNAIKYSPEFETCQKLALEKGLPLQSIYQEITAAIARLETDLPADAT